MKKYEVPEINISLFDNTVATDGSAQATAMAEFEKAGIVATSKDWESTEWNVTF